MARVTLLPGYRYSGGSYVCVNCAHDENNRELLKTFGAERDPIFYGECSDIKGSKCVICKIKLVDVVSNAYSRSSGSDDGEGEAPAKKASPTKTADPKKATVSQTKKKKAPAKKTTEKKDAPKKRGRPPKAKTAEVEPAVKRGRGRPKGSKNKTKFIFNLSNG